MPLIQKIKDINNIHLLTDLFKTYTTNFLPNENKTFAGKATIQTWTKVVNKNVSQYRSEGLKVI